MPTDVDAVVGAEHGDGHARRLTGTVGRRADDEVEGEGVVEHLDAGHHRRLVEGALHLGAAAVAAGVDDAVVAVPALAGEGRDGRVGAGRVERRAESHEVADRLGRLGDELAHHALVAQPGAGGEGVAHVVLERVGGVEHAGEAALGPRRRAGVEGALGDDQHAAHRAGGERGGEPGRTRAEDDDVDLALPGGCGRGEPQGQSGRSSCAHSAGRRRAIADGDHPLHRRPRPLGDVGRHGDLVAAVAQRRAAAWPA